MRSGPFQLSGCLLAGSEHSGIGGLPYVAGISRKIVENPVYTAQGILERISVIESRSLISAILEAPEVVMCVPWLFFLTVVRDRIQRSSVLAAVSRYDAYYMRVWPHDNPGIVHWDAPPFAVGDDAGDEIDPLIKVES